MSSPPVPMDLDEGDHGAPLGQSTSQGQDPDGHATGITGRTSHHDIMDVDHAGDLGLSASAISNRFSLANREATPPRDLTEDQRDHADPSSTPLAIPLTPTTSSSIHTNSDDYDTSPHPTPTDDVVRASSTPVTYAGRHTVRPSSLKPRTILLLQYRDPSPDRLCARDGNVAASSPTLSAPDLPEADPEEPSPDDEEPSRSENQDHFIVPEALPRGRKRRNSISRDSPFRPKRIALRASSAESSSSSAHSIPPSRRLTPSASTFSSVPASSSPSRSSSSASSSSSTKSTKSGNTYRPMSTYNPLGAKPTSGKSAWSTNKLTFAVSADQGRDNTYKAGPKCGRRADGTGSDRGVKVRKHATVAMGETILRSSLTFAALHNEMVDTHCWGCHTSWEDKAQRLGVDVDACKDRYLRCERCQTALWCSLKCYAKNAENHHPECRALKRCDTAPSAQVRAIAKVFHAMASKWRMTLPQYDRPPLDADRIKELKLLVKQVTTFLSRTHDHELDVDWAEYKLTGPGEVIRLIRQLQAMTLEMRDQYGRPIGLCVVNRPTRIRHSCTPNAYVAFPEGLDAQDPLRIISLEEIRGDEEVTVSYASVLTPCHMRATVLLSAGFEHDCGECANLMRSVDPRWASWHEDCAPRPRQGAGSRGAGERLSCTSEEVGAERGMMALEYDKSSLEERSCPVCHEMELTFERSWDHDRAVESMMQWYSEAGVNWSIMPVAESDDSTEIEILTTAIRRLEGRFPETVWPLPLIRHRIASLVLLQCGRTVEDLYIALEDLGKAHAAHRQLTGRATVSTVWIRIQMCRAYEGIIGKLVHVGVFMKSWQDRRRKLARDRLGACQRVKHEVNGSVAEEIPAGKVETACASDREPRGGQATNGAKTDTSVAENSNTETNIDDNIEALSPEEEQEIIEASTRLKGVIRYLGSVPFSVRPQPPRRPKSFTIKDIDDEAKSHVEQALEAWNTARAEWREVSAGMDGVDSGKWLLGRQVQKVWGDCKALAGYFGVDTGMRSAR